MDDPGIPERDDMRGQTAGMGDHEAIVTPSPT
jgi:hypothetical protein